MISKIFPASVSELDHVNDFLDEEFEKHDIAMRTAIQIKVAVEEIFVNVASYAYEGGNGDVQIDLDITGDAVTLRFIDSGMYFDPLAKPDPDITLSAEERGIGGLGIFMVKKTMDDVDYRYENSRNILTIVKKI